MNYLVIHVGGAVIAEAGDVKVKIIAKNVESTSQDDGGYASYIGGTVKIGIAGGFLLAADRDNWDTLFDYMKNGTYMGISLYNAGDEVLSGIGIIKILSTTGSNVSELTTGRYGIQFFMNDSYKIMTEDGLNWLTTEDGRILLTED